MRRARVQAGLAGAILAAACCNALLPVRVDSFALSPPFPAGYQSRPSANPGVANVARPSQVQSQNDFVNAHFGLRLRGGECTPPPSHAGISLQACAGGGDGVTVTGSDGPKLFAVEGLIGAGKSTLLAKLRGEKVGCVFNVCGDMFCHSGVLSACLALQCRP